MAPLAHRSKIKAAAKPIQPRKKSAGAAPVAVRNAKRQAKKIVESLHEAEQIHKGKRKGKTFDEFLEELLAQKDDPIRHTKGLK